MKLLLTVTTVLILLLTGCAPDTPHFETEKRPFIVKGITEYSETHNTYKAGSFTTLNMLQLQKPSIVAPKGIAEIGDTLTVVAVRGN